MDSYSTDTEGSSGAGLLSYFSLKRRPRVVETEDPRSNLDTCLLCDFGLGFPLTFADLVTGEQMEAHASIYLQVIN